MYLSRVEVPWSHARNPYDLHRALWTLFPEKERESRKRPEENRTGFLFRVENSGPGSPSRVLMQSATVPGDRGKWATLLTTKPFNPQPTKRQMLRFLITANPIKSIIDRKHGRMKDAEHPKRVRVPLIQEQAQRDWLRKKLGGAAALDEIGVRPEPPLFFRKGRQGGKVVPITFEGLLTVVDPGHLRCHLENGIGPAKGFGCGLLLVRRL